MAVEIIKAGELPSEKIYKATCNHCHTIFSFQEKDASLKFDQKEGDYMVISCPLKGCGHTVTVFKQPKSAWRGNA